MSAPQPIEGIGLAYAEKLRTAGVRTTDDLLDHASTAGGRKNLAGTIGVTEALVLEWADRADLMRVPGIGEEFSDLLEAAGVDTVKELATRRPENLHARLEAVNEEKHLVRQLPSEDQVTHWVDEGHNLPAVLTC